MKLTLSSYLTDKTYFQVQELEDKMKISGMPWPDDEGEQRWEQAWMAIKKVSSILHYETTHDSVL